jgi:thioredoxin 1
MPDDAQRMNEVTSATFEAVVLASPIPVVVDFWAPWCKPCEAIDPHLRSLADEWGGRARLVRVNVDEEAGLASRYGVLSLPTVILFADGEPRATVYGAQSRARFERDFAPFV